MEYVYVVLLFYVVGKEIIEENFKVVFEVVGVILDEVRIKVFVVVFEGVNIDEVIEKVVMLVVVLVVVVVVLVVEGGVVEVVQEEEEEEEEEVSEEEVFVGFGVFFG